MEEENVNKEDDGNDKGEDRNLLEDDEKYPWIKIIWDGPNNPLPIVDVIN